MPDYKEYAKHMRENAVKNEQGNIVCSPELWEEIASVIERAIVPPCKVGDTLYVISQMKDKRILPFVNKYEVTFIQVGKRKCKVYHEKDGFIKIFKQDDFGKTVFLSEEQANKKIKGVKQK